MRELRVVGVDADGSLVICQDVESGIKYTIPADERLRAAARGDLSRLGQIEIEMTSTLRPREIQSRIRAGATVAEVAAIAGVSTDKVERFAHPVLLERTRAAELATQAHPLRHDGLSDQTLGDVTTQALMAFGQNPLDATWDAWKGEDGYWAVQIAWQVGHTEHRAHWRYQPGSHGGTADPLDDLAEEMTHPELIEPRRRLTPVATPAIAPVVAPTIDVDDVGREQVTLDADSIIGAQRTRRDPHHAPFDEHGTYALDFDTPDFDTPAFDTLDFDTPATSAPVAAHHPRAVSDPSVHGRHRNADVPRDAPPDSPHATAVTDVDAADEAHVETSSTTTEPDHNRPATGEDRDGTPAKRTSAPADTESNRAESNRAESDRAESDRADTDRTDTESAGDPPPTPVTTPRKRKSRKPQVPAWEDVLLGVRSHPNS